jgi:hypothetical protein
MRAIFEVRVRRWVAAPAGSAARLYAGSRARSERALESGIPSYSPFTNPAKVSPRNCGSTSTIAESFPSLIQTRLIALLESWEGRTGFIAWQADTAQTSSVARNRGGAAWLHLSVGDCRV